MPALVPRQITWDTLEKSRNPAALQLLASGLSSPYSEVRMQCLKALLSRPEILARHHVLLAWEKLTEPEIEFIRANILHFQAAAHNLLLTGSLDEQRSALCAISQLLLTGCIPAVLKIVIHPLHALQVQANDCLQTVCRHWGIRTRDAKDVPSIRTPLLDAVYACVLEYPKHKSIQVIDAWLNLVHWDDSAQRGLLADPGHCAFRVVVDRLRATENEQHIKLLAGYLLRATTPKSVQLLVVEKADQRLAFELAKMIDTPNWTPLKRRLRELPVLSCLQNIETDFTNLSVADKKRLWLLMSVSSKDYGQVLRGAVQIAKLGNADGRQVAAEMVRNVKKPDLDTMVGDLQTALAGLAKPHSAGPALLETILWVQSASVPLRKAAAELFSEFTVAKLIEQVSFWPTSMCKAMAHVVSITSNDITSYLVKELESPSPKRRLAALRATQMLSHSESVSQYLLPMLDDPKLDVRVRVIDLLSELDGTVLEQLLPGWLNDVSTDIQEAAKRVMRRRERAKKSVSPNLDAPPNAFAAELEVTQ